MVNIIRNIKVKYFVIWNSVDFMQLQDSLSQLLENTNEGFLCMKASIYCVSDFSDLFSKKQI